MSELATTSEEATASYELLDEIVSSDGRFSVGLSRQIRVAMRTFVEGRGALDLAECFGWKPTAGGGGRSIARRLSQAKRVAAFADAYRMMLDVERLSSWKRCEVLAHELAEFERLRWPLYREGGLPAGASARDSTFFEIFSALDQRPAMGTPGIHLLLKRAGVLN